MDETKQNHASPMRITNNVKNFIKWHLMAGQSSLLVPKVQAGKFYQCDFSLIFLVSAHDPV